CQQLYSTPLTF
nr:immunoglobulin light chain junction region [Mus musculus]NSM00826.1 immunoglobulin light chain junction region [Mus musculus]